MATLDIGRARRGGREAERASARAVHLSRRFEGAAAGDVVRAAVKDLFPGKVALVSSFGADSAVLLHVVASVDPATPVLFVNTGQHFEETLAHRDALVRMLGLTGVRSVGPDPSALASEDPEAFLWNEDPDRCCAIRKVAPLAPALEGFGAWISGRKRHQAATRSGLAAFESDGTRTKVNPLAQWTADDVEAYRIANGLPEHPLVRLGFPSIGCAPCTSRVAPGEDPRAGRWRGRDKVECGIHLPALEHEGSGI